MKLCILDPACHVPGLKLLFPEADYFSHEPDSFFNFVATKHYTKQENLHYTGIEYDTDWTKINSRNYDTLFIVAPLADYFDPLNIDFGNSLIPMRNRIKHIIDNNTFSSISLFDIYDYDYDPSTMNTLWCVSHYFKRNYNKNKKYNSNVYPFPYIMFTKPCVLTMCINHDLNEYCVKNNAAVWCGGLYNHIDEKRNIKRNRLDIYNQIKDTVITVHNVPREDWIRCIKSTKIIVDLIGVGEPNHRTFEVLTNGTLILSMNRDLEWGFDKGDVFHEYTFFNTAEEFKYKLYILLTDDTVYKQCLEQQNTIIKKYFNKNFFREYILSHINNMV
jgi:hypothetical protein